MASLSGVPLKMHERKELNFGRFIGYAFTTLTNSLDESTKVECSHGGSLGCCERTWDCIADYWNGYADKYIKASTEKNLQHTCMSRHIFYGVKKYLRVFNHMLKHSGIKYSNKCHTCSRFITRGTYACQNFNCIAMLIKDIYPKYKAFRVKFNKKFQERLRKMEEDEMDRRDYEDYLDDRDDRYDRFDDYDDYRGPRCGRCGDELEPFCKYGGFCSYGCHEDYERSYDSD